MPHLSHRATMGVLVALSVLAVGTLMAELPEHLGRLSPWGGYIGGGMQFGTFFSVVAMAAFWTVVGTSPFLTRIAHVLVGFGATLLALLLNVLLAGRFVPQTPVMFGILTLAGATLGMLLAGPMWLLTMRRNIRLRHIRELSHDALAADQQFGIREILVVTATTAVVLGSIRWLIQIQPLTKGLDVGEGMVFITGLAAFNVFVTLPLLIAPLLRRFALPSTLIGLALIAVATACENPIIRQLRPHPASESLTIWAMNSTQAAWVLLTLGTLRLGGYRLAAPQTNNEAAGSALIPKDQP